MNVQDRDFFLKNGHLYVLAVPNVDIEHGNDANLDVTSLNLAKSQSMSLSEITVGGIPRGGETKFWEFQILKHHPQCLNMWNAATNGILAMIKEEAPDERILETIKRYIAMDR